MQISGKKLFFLGLAITFCMSGVGLVLISFSMLPKEGDLETIIGVANPKATVSTTYNGGESYVTSCSLDVEVFGVGMRHLSVPGISWVDRIPVKGGCILFAGRRLEFKDQDNWVYAFHSLDDKEPSLILQYDSRRTREGQLSKVPFWIGIALLGVGLGALINGYRGALGKPGAC